MEEFYILLNKKEESQKDFLEFMDYMVINANQRFGDEKIQNDFNYHFNKLPGYIRDRFKMVEHQLLGNLADANMHITRATENLKKLI